MRLSVLQLYSNYLCTGVFSIVTAFSNWPYVPIYGRPIEPSRQESAASHRSPIWQFAVRRKAIYVIRRLVIQGEIARNFLPQHYRMNIIALPVPDFVGNHRNACNFKYSNTACLSPLPFTSANVLPVPTISYQQQGYSILSLYQCFSPLKRLLSFSMYLQQHDTVWLGYFITSCLSLSLSANDCRFQSTVLFIEHHHSADPVTKSAKQSLCPSYSGFEWNSQLMLNLMP